MGNHEKMHLIAGIFPSQADPPPAIPTISMLLPRFPSLRKAIAQLVENRYNYSINEFIGTA